MSDTIDIDQHDMTGWWCAIFDGEAQKPCALGKSEEDVREQLIQRYMKDDACDRAEAERWLGNADVCIAKCAVRVAWYNHYEHIDDEPQTWWLNDEDDGG